MTARLLNSCRWIILCLAGAGLAASAAAQREQAFPPVPELGSARVNLGDRPAKRILLRGMTYTKPSPWRHPRDTSMRYFIGDELGRIRLEYADGSTQVFPLILGQGIWFGALFRDFPEPYSSDGRLRAALAESLRVYPPAPTPDASYLAVITPKAVPLRSLTLEASPVKWGVPKLDGVTLVPPGSDDRALAPELRKFVAEKALLPLSDEGNPMRHQLEDLRQALYLTDEQFPKHVGESGPNGYAGPHIAFAGDLSAEILANAFRWNLQDMADKVDATGMYHTSTAGAPSWGGYNGFGTYRARGAPYYGHSWSRDMGRTLQELSELGYADQASRSVDYSLRMARLWQEDPRLKYKGVMLPPHWGRIINLPDKPHNRPFENDGHGLITLALYKVWQRRPDRDAWLRSRWPDVKAAGDWILWQFAHPDISGAANGLLYTTGESAPPNGYSVYPDAVCMAALEGLAQMADSIGETATAAAWRDRAARMRAAITAGYIVKDPKLGRVWTPDYAGFPDKTTVLGPLIFLADASGLAPEDDDPRWRPVNEATYVRLTENHLPAGFYGRAMGYGQGFVTQSALLLDRMRDATRLLDWAARQIYNPKRGSFIVPEGCDIDPTRGHDWFWLGDLGNGVQEAEIVKALRVMIGVDDTRPDRLQFFPRMPYGWSRMAVNDYPVLAGPAAKAATAHVRYELKRVGRQMQLSLSCDRDLGPVLLRVGPFAQRPEAADLLFNGAPPAGVTIEWSGDSWWARYTASVGPR